MKLSAGSKVWQMSEGEHLKQMRLEANLTQQQLAVKCGLGAYMISQLEHGSASLTNVPFGSIVLLTDALGLNNPIDLLDPRTSELLGEQNSLFGEKSSEDILALLPEIRGYYPECVSRAEELRRNYIVELEIQTARTHDKNIIMKALRHAPCSHTDDFWLDYDKMIQAHSYIALDRDLAYYGSFARPVIPEMKDRE